MLLKLIFLLVMLPLMWLPGLFDQISVSTANGTITYSYNIVPWIFISLMAIAFISFGEYVRRTQKDNLGGLIFHAGVPLMAFLSLQLAYERVSLTNDRLLYSREPPHTALNASISWNQIVVATKVQRESQEPFAGRHFRIGYKFVLQDGAEFELPTCDTLTAAAVEIDDELKRLGIPITVETIPLG